MIASSALRHSKSHRQASIRNINLRAKRMVTRYELGFNNRTEARMGFAVLKDKAVRVSEGFNEATLRHTVIADFKTDPGFDDRGCDFVVLKKEQVRKP